MRVIQLCGNTVAYPRKKGVSLFKIFDREFLLHRKTLGLQQLRLGNLFLLLLISVLGTIKVANADYICCAILYYKNIFLLLKRQLIYFSGKD